MGFEEETHQFQDAYDMVGDADSLVDFLEKLQKNLLEGAAFYLQESEKFTSYAKAALAEADRIQYILSFDEKLMTQGLEVDDPVGLAVRKPTDEYI